MQLKALQRTRHTHGPHPPPDENNVENPDLDKKRWLTIFRVTVNTTLIKLLLREPQ